MAERKHWVAWVKAVVVTLVTVALGTVLGARMQPVLGPLLDPTPVDSSPLHFPIERLVDSAFVGLLIGLIIGGTWSCAIIPIQDESDRTH